MAWRLPIPKLSTSLPDASGSLPPRQTAIHRLKAVFPHSARPCAYSSRHRNSVCDKAALRLPLSPHQNVFAVLRRNFVFFARHAHFLSPARFIESHHKNDAAQPFPALLCRAVCTVYGFGTPSLSCWASLRFAAVSNIFALSPIQKRPLK